MEVRLIGKPVSPGFAQGTAFLRRTFRDEELPRFEIAKDCVAAELDRFERALERSRTELSDLQTRVLCDLGSEQSAIFSAHVAMLADPHFVDKVRARIVHELVNAEQALETEVRELTALLSEVDSEYLRERAHDIRDVGQRVMRHLCQGNDGHYGELPTASVIIARELLPSETLDLDRHHVVAIVTELGGENSHSAILARSLGIPSVAGLPEATSKIKGGEQVLVDGECGRIIIRPRLATVRSFSDDKLRYDSFSQVTRDAQSLPCCTSDGQQVKLLANIGHSGQGRDVLAHGLAGVGLFRTEFLFMQRSEAPTEEDHFQAYRSLGESLANLPIAIRTLDLGGDKVARFVEQHFETNPHLGLRGLRYSLTEPGLFDTQLRAIVRARAHGDFRVLLPMVTGVDEIVRATERLSMICDELQLPPPQIGAMIETPAAVFAIDEITQAVDFLSIGTNDLTQFMLAADRDASYQDEYSILHPAVIRAVARIVEAGEQHGRPVCICGEAAGDPAIACLLVGLGVRELSSSPLRSARVRYAIRSQHASDLQQRAREALASPSEANVRELLPDV